MQTQIDKNRWTKFRKSLNQINAIIELRSRKNKKRIIKKLASAKIVIEYYERHEIDTNQTIDTIIGDIEMIARNNARIDICSEKIKTTTLPGWSREPSL